MPASRPDAAFRPLTCFKAYDIRGVLGETIDADAAYRIGRAFVEVLGAASVAVGYDARESSPGLAAALRRGIADAGAEVLDCGQCGTEEIYFAAGHFAADGGIEVTASHNPIEFNGMKLVAAGARPLNPATELPELRRVAEAGAFRDAERRGAERSVAEAARQAYVARVLSFVDVAALRPMKLVVNCGNGAAGPAYEAIKAALARAGAPIAFVDQFRDPDPTFPNGIPNPLLPENQPVTRDRVLAEAADMGVAFDGDFDRCFFFDGDGRFIPGEYIVGLLADAFLDKEPGAKIVHDPRIVLNSRDIIAAKGGVAVQSRTGHAFIKQAMRQHDAIYGGEMSAHHYFRDFFYCDSGMIPWLLVCELVGKSGMSLSELVSGRMRLFPSSGEINFVIADPDAAIEAVVAAFRQGALREDRSDGVSLEFADWRFNLRASNTEAVVRLNVESCNDPGGLNRHVVEIREILARHAG